MAMLFPQFPHTKAAIPPGYARKRDLAEGEMQYSAYETMSVFREIGMNLVNSTSMMNYSPSLDKVQGPFTRETGSMTVILHANEANRVSHSACVKSSQLPRIFPLSPEGGAILKDSPRLLPKGSFLVGLDE